MTWHVASSRRRGSDDEEFNCGTVGDRDAVVFEVRMTPPKKVVSIKLEVDLIAEIDRLWPKLGYRSRSDFIREAILYYMQIAPKLHGKTEKSRQDRKLDTRMLDDFEKALEGLEELDLSLDELGYEEVSQ